MLPTACNGFSSIPCKTVAFFQEFSDCARLRQELVFLRRELVFLRNLARPCAGVRLRILVFFCVWTPKQTFPTNSNQFGLMPSLHVCWQTCFWSCYVDMYKSSWLLCMDMYNSSWWLRMEPTQDAHLFLQPHMLG